MVSLLSTKIVNIYYLIHQAVFCLLCNNINDQSTMRQNTSEYQQLQHKMKYSNGIILQDKTNIIIRPISTDNHLVGSIVNFNL